MNIYLASSWRNCIQPFAVKGLRLAGHTVYDFHHPRPNDNGFAWEPIDPGWRSWEPRQFIDGLAHPLAQRGFGFDFKAMKLADACLLLTPCGRSAHMEAGWMKGRGKPVVVVLEEGFEVELMYLMFDHLCTTIDEAVEWLKVGTKRSP